ncbi:surface glycan-binding family protein [Flammeovirga aprica]|uniref:DUF4958 family protein n=1 Tax=Flammeovirga aprica JL-4 TaxID=694437 RepID=A0A7X9P0J1_9BACT|nr:surface glycan-binding family protein [Flammeovirga aprica]NME66772.1 DUF4958 family protein [Flammeovirga aprica JL-4]
MRSKLFNYLIICIPLLMTGFMSSCNKSEESKPNIFLAYMDIEDIAYGSTFSSFAPSKSINLNNFFIDKVTYSKGDTSFIYEGDEFTINDTTGIISNLSSTTIPIGKYTFDISVNDGTLKHTFSDIFSLNIVEGAPHELVYTPSKITVEKGEGFITAPPTIKGLETFDFQLLPTTAFDYLTINEENGVIALSNNNKLTYGVYKVPVKVTSNGKQSIFSEALEITVRSLEGMPQGLKYAPEKVTLSLGESFTSDAPTLDETTITPVEFQIANEDLIYQDFTIDPSTGVISLQEGHFLDIGTYDITIIAKNEIGEAIFDKALSIEILKNFEITYDQTDILSTIVLIGDSFQGSKPFVEEGFEIATYEIVGNNENSAFSITPEGEIQLDATNSASLTKGVKKLRIKATSSTRLDSFADYQVAMADLTNNSKNSDLRGDIVHPVIDTVRIDYGKTLEHITPGRGYYIGDEIPQLELFQMRYFEFKGEIDGVYREAKIDRVQSEGDGLAVMEYLEMGTSWTIFRTWMYKDGNVPSNSDNVTLEEASNFMIDPVRFKPGTYTFTYRIYTGGELHPVHIPALVIISK